MRRTLLLTTLLCSALGAAVLAAADRSAVEPTTKPTTQQSDKPVNKFCAIEKENEIDPKVTTVYKGKTVGFCCSACIKEFNKDPDKYMATLK